jgi:hypothetical protein
MKKVFFVILGIGLFSTAAVAQRGNNQVGVYGKVVLPAGDNSDFSKVGFGGTVKALYGVGNAGQVTLTSGYVTFSGKDVYKHLLGADKITQSVIPVLAGYRHNFHGFYVEPQIGYGIYGAKIKGGMFDGNDSEGAFTWAAGAGYVFKGIEIGAVYQSGHKNGESNGSVGFRIGYNFSVGRM